MNNVQKHNIWTLFKLVTSLSCILSTFLYLMLYGFVYDLTSLGCPHRKGFNFVYQAVQMKTYPIIPYMHLPHVLSVMDRQWSSHSQVQPILLLMTR
jgi:hypothetical protein